MRENLHRFFRAARGAGVKLSPAESIDAMRAVAKVGISDRAILRDTFLLTLAKTQDEKKALGDCFDLFFDQPEPQALPDDSEADEPDTEGSDQAAGSPGDASGGGEQAEGLGQLAQMLLAQDRPAADGGHGQQRQLRIDQLQAEHRQQAAGHQRATAGSS